MSSAPHPDPPVPGESEPHRAAPGAHQLRRWRKYLAEERTEVRIYRLLAARSSGREREILHQIAEGEQRHVEHWARLLGPHAGTEARASLYSRLLTFLAAHFGSVFVLALLQRAESRSPYETEQDASDAMAADEAVHEEIIRALATEGRHRLSGNFRAAVFGANDGLVSNLALVMGVGATGTSPAMVLFAGIAGLLAGALSMGAGEYVSVRSQRELLEASQPTQVTLHVAPNLDLDANELVLIYRARGMSEEAAEHRAAERLGFFDCDCDPSRSVQDPVEDEPREQPNVALGTDLGAAASSFCFFASGALIPILPYLVGLTGAAAMVTSLALVGLALLVTGGMVGLLSGASPWKRGLRQLGIGYGAALATYALGLVFNTSVA